MSQNSRAPVAAAIRPAATRPSPRSDAPRSRIAVDRPLRSAATDRSDRRRRHRRGRRHRERIGRCRRREPRHVGRHDQRGDLTGRLTGGLHRTGSVGCHRPGTRRRVQPPRHRAGEPDDVRRERRVVLRVIRGVVADDVHDRRRGPARVVQVGEPVGQARPEVQQRRRRALRHAGVAVGHARHDTLEQARAPAASRRHDRSRRRSASPRCRGSRSTPRRRSPRASAADSRLRSLHLDTCRLPPYGGQSRGRGAPGRCPGGCNHRRRRRHIIARIRA